MKKIIKLLLIFVFTSFFIANKVEANSIQSLSMDIFVSDDGDAYVTEIWECNVTEGTEMYHPYYNLQNSLIKDLEVTDGNTKYTLLSKWKTSGTLSSKANKCGINEISDGVELCWGISDYGAHTYTVKYTITNFVYELKDAQMIYWNLVPYDFSNSIGKAYIKIYTNFEIEDTIDVWGYGNYGGTSYVYDGYIEMQSAGRLTTNEYMTILVKFPLETFNTKNKLNKTFDYYFEMAEKGTTKFVSSNDSFFTKAILVFFGFALVYIFFLIIIHTVSSCFSYGKEGKKIPKDIPYFRDLPCKKDIYRAYYIGIKYGIIKKETNLLGAVILKWLKDGIIKIEEKEKGLVFKKENTVIVLPEPKAGLLTNLKEKELFDMLYEASKDGYLESKEFEEWCKNNYSKVLSWFKDIKKIEENKLVDEGILLKTAKIIKKLTATPELKQYAIELAGLKRYLKDFTLVKEREAVEVQLFEEYLIFAQLMGIAEKVAKEFKDVYPEIIEQSHFTSYDYIMFVRTSSSSGISAAVSTSRANSYSSGGGGFSSGGGGGGSFGGGHGGRRFPLKNIK